MPESDDKKTSLPDEVDDCIGRELAGCRIEKKLGEGAMGKVFLAEQLSLRRKVAVKILDAKFSKDKTYIERFEREARAAASLGQFNIVQVYAFGREGDLYYIINEYVDGGNVQELIDSQGTISPEEANNIAMQAAQGLAAALEHSIVHRDIKPENLMLTSQGIVKIADFGLAKAVSDDAAVTQSGMIVGTPYYMSPEQAKGLHLDIRSDIYSLGVTLFFMLTGQLPFDAESVIGVLLKQISAERPDPLTINPSIPDSLGRIVMKMMARNPEDRHQTPTELIQALNHEAEELDSDWVEGEELSIERYRERLNRYKILPAKQVHSIRRRDVNDKMLDRMLHLVKGDSGVFIESEELFPENTILEVGFGVPGRNDDLSAIGIVRWAADFGDRRGVGVTFLKVGATGSSHSSQRRFASTGLKLGHPQQLPPVSSSEALYLLTQSSLHCRLLRYYYANVNQTVTEKQIANGLGVGKRMLEDPLDILTRVGLARRGREDAVMFVWPEDDELQEKLIAWISEYGLLG